MEAPFTDVLIPLDGSPAAELALGPALELVRRTGVPLRVMTASLPGDDEALAGYLADVAEKHAGVTAIETEVVSAEGVAEAILDDMLPQTLVCMSSHGRGGLSRAVMGSVAEAVLRSIVDPALIVGPALADAAPFAGRVVACLDGSPESDRTLGPAQEWAATLGLPLWLVQVGEPGAPADWITHGDVHESGHLASLAARLGGVEGWDVLHGRDPAHALVDLTTSHAEPTGLLVMATHGRTGWDRLRLGSVTAATIHEATVPVLVVSAAPKNVRG
ncbi:MAG TPA: universal stress protein [Acidimicrobiales bacterium]